MVEWPLTIVAWPFSDILQIFFHCLKHRKNVVWQSADGRVTSDLCRVTVQRLLFKLFSNCLKRLKNVVWQSTDGRVTSDHCRVNVQRLLSKFSKIAWKVGKTLFDSRPMIAWPPTTLAWPFRDFFRNFPKLLETSKNVVRQPADGRVTSDHCCVTVQRLFSRNFIIAWNVQKTLFDSRPMVAWPPITVAWPFGDFFLNFLYLLETSKNVVWQAADDRVTSDNCHVTV